MGGHGALTIGLKNPERYVSLSAFSPIVAPTQCPWGKKAFTQYLGSNESDWADYDTCALLASATEHRPILIDQGTADNFLEEQLKTPLITAASEAADYPVHVRMQHGYDHSYYFIASFMADHLRFHAKYLNAH
jgi:S-formylglutathione hydrolase